jgi:hypothetical protein
LIHPIPRPAATTDIPPTRPAMKLPLGSALTLPQSTWPSCRAKKTTVSAPKAQVNHVISLTMVAWPSRPMAMAAGATMANAIARLTLPPPTPSRSRIAWAARLDRAIRMVSQPTSTR